MRTFQDAKLMANALRRAVAERNLELSHSETLEIVARQFGCDSWNVLAAQIAASGGKPEAAAGVPVFRPAIPIFRIFDVEKAREFYCGFLGFAIDWEHRFGADFPLYCQVSRGNMLLHLSEHSGDASPGAKAFVHMTGIAAFHRELTEKAYRYMKPGLEEQPWGRQVEVTDPFSNRIAFCERP